ncbi:MAG: hypothetical protein HXY46_09740 [Syntrophaceae bacterium]|nr:hypothetical protein [Syntrophaceae bacterium]
MGMIIKDLASIQLFVIFALIVMGFGIIRIVKRRFEDYVNGNQLLGICEMDGVRRIEISFKRVATWTLIFTNAFFVPYFFARLLRLV